MSARLLDHLRGIFLMLPGHDFRHLYATGFELCKVGLNALFNIRIWTSRRDSSGIDAWVALCVLCK